LQTTDHLHHETAAVQSNFARVLVSLELSRSTWLITALAPDGEKMSRHQVEGGDADALLGEGVRLLEKRVGMHPA
jgi:transposase